MKPGRYRLIVSSTPVAKQTQGATFGEKVNAGLHAAGSAMATGAGSKTKHETAKNSVANVLALSANWAWYKPQYLPFTPALDEGWWIWIRYLLPVLMFVTPVVARPSRRRPAVVLLGLVLVFTILGKGHETYTERLHRLVDEYQLSEYVTFQAPIPRAELPEFLGRFDVLLLTSIWAEPLARIMQEGLASGMVVIGSATGGTAETIVHDENGLLFKAGDAAELADRINLLLDQPSKRRLLADSGVRTAKQRFDINVMVSELEKYLEQVHAKTR